MFRKFILAIMLILITFYFINLFNILNFDKKQFGNPRFIQINEKSPTDQDIDLDTQKRFNDINNKLDLLLDKANTNILSNKEKEEREVYRSNKEEEIKEKEIESPLSNLIEQRNDENVIKEDDKQSEKKIKDNEESELKFKDEVDWIEYADYEFNIDESKLPKSKDVIFQVIITDQIDHWAGKNLDDSKLKEFTEPLCKSVKNWNEGLITLHTSNSNFEFCDGWENSFIVKFDAKMIKHVSLHDERLFVVEQFIKKYRLYERYGNIMLSDCDVYMLRNNSWNYFDKECPSKKFWFAFWDDTCEELYYDPFSATSSQIKECYGESTLPAMHKSKMKNLNFPIAGRGRYFTKLLEYANNARVDAIKNMNNNSPKTVCDMASVFYTVWKNDWIKDTCMHGIRFSDYAGAFSHKAEADGYRPYLDNIIPPMSFGTKIFRMNDHFYNYERRYNSLCYFSNVASKILKKEKIIPIRDLQHHLLTQKIQQRFPDFYLFNSSFSLDSPHEPMKFIHTEFDFTNLDLLPNTEDIIFQVLIFGEHVFTGEKLDIKDFSEHTPPLCYSSKKFNTSLITLYDSSTVPPTSCSSWKNSILIKFKNKLRPHLPISDARFFILEQFIRQFKLYNKYKKMMFAEPNTYVLKEGGLAEVEKICPPTQDLYLTTFDGQCSLLENSLEKGLREKIRKCYGIEMLKQMEKDKMKSFYFPFASNSHHFLFLLWKLNLERIYLRDFIFKHDSAFYECDEATLNVAIWKLKEKGKVCEKGLKFADHNSVFSTSSYFPPYSINVRPQIDAIMVNNKVPELTQEQTLEKRSLELSCSDQKKIKERNQKEEEEESKRYRVKLNDHVRMTHNNTGYRMISRGNYETGSHCRKVYGYYEHELLADYGWHIRNPEDYEDENYLEDGSVIFFKHDNSDTFMYSEPGAESPVSKQQEICAGLSEDEKEKFDHYVVHTVNGNKYLNYYQEFTLTHEETGCYLQANKDREFSEGTEISCSMDGDTSDNNWIFIQRH